MAAWSIRDRGVPHVSPLSAVLHVCEGGVCERRLAGLDKDTTFDVPFKLAEDFLRDFSLASARASINADAEVRTPNDP
jgi:hypothetical protein